MLRQSIPCALCLLAGASLAAQTPGVTLSPFVTLRPSESASSMAGLALSLSDGPLALRAGGHFSLQEHNSSAPSGVTTRPWGADADAMAYLPGYDESRRFAFVPYVFAGIGTMATDSSGYRLTRRNWSYGGGLTAPLGSSLGLLAEARWRMNEFVMPNSSNAPSPTHEYRLGLNFRVGSGGSGPEVLHVLGNAAEVLGTNSVGDIVGRILSTAGQFVGSPYRRGGMSPSGFDAAGFVRFIFSRFGVTLPRDPRDQARVGESIRADVRNLRPGDLVMFEDGDGIMHVAIYAGRSQIIHSSETGGGVLYDDLTTDRGRWFLSHIAAARRVTPDSRGSSIDLSRGYPDANSDERPDRAPKASRRR